MENSSYMDNVMLFLLGSILISTILSRISLIIAPIIGLLDRPESADHKSHTKPIPLTGGLVLLITLVIMIIIGDLWGESDIRVLMVCGIIVGLFGLIDDLISLSPLLKLIGQIFASLLLIYLGIQVNIFSAPEFFLRTGTFIDSLLNLLLTIIWMVSLTNAFNFIDSSDGLSIGIGGLASIFFLVISITTGQVVIIYFCTLLLGTCIGLYFFNSFPARLFLGDCGSQTLGFLLASIAIIYTPITGIQSSSWFVPILIFYVPLLDLSLVIYSRMKRGKKIYKASKDHTYHRLIERGISVQRSVLILHGASLFMSIIGYLCLNLSIINANIIFSLTSFLGLFVIITLDKKYK